MDQALPIPAERSPLAANGIGLCGSFVLAIVLFPEAAKLTLTNWNSGAGAYGAGWLMTALAIWTFWDQRAERLSFQAAFRVDRLLLLVPVVLLSTLALWQESVTLSCVAALAIVLALRATVFGFAAAASVFAPLLIIACALPMWSWLREPLQIVASHVVAFGFQAFQVPVHLEGTIISLPAATFEVAKGCSGLNYLLVSVCVALSASVWSKVEVSQLVKQIVLAVGFALTVNWLRIAIITYVGNASQMQSPLVDEHVTFGWVLFGVLLLPYCYFVLPKRLVRRIG